MWQKAHPIWMRVGTMKSWPCEWFAKNKRISNDFFVEDIKVRDFIDKKFKNSWISKVIIRKTAKEGEIIVFTSKVGLIMWKQGNKIKELEDELKEKFSKDFKLVVKEVRVPEFSARIMAEFIGHQLEERMPFRKIAKGVLAKVMEKWASWIKIQIAWRLNGADIARCEKFIQWRVSLQTFRSDIDYHYLQAMTKYWVLWVKVRIQKGILYPKQNKKSVKTLDII